jgi:hypothetical protein
MGAGNAASGSQAVAMGSFNTASNSSATAMGSSNIASGGQGVAIGSSNTASGASAFATGTLSSASSTYATAMGNSSASTPYATAMGNGSASGSYSTAMGQSSATNGWATAMGYSFANGGYSTASGSSLAAQWGKWTTSGSPFSSVGSAQTGMIVLGAATTTNTSVVLTSDGSSALAYNQLIVSSNQAMAFTGELIGKQSGSANIAAYTITGTLVNNAGTVTMPTGTLTAIGTDTIGLTTAPTLAADNTNKGLTVTSGAKTTTNIRWVCTLRSTEVVYA